MKSDMKHSVRLIVLHSTKLGEKSLVIHCLSPQYGRRSFICTAGRSSAALVQPLSILDAEVTENPKSELWRAGSLSTVHPLTSLRTNLYKNSIALFISEVLYRTIKDGANEDGLADWCEKSIVTLEDLPGAPGNFHLRWLLEFAGALGFSPSTEDIAPFAGTQLSHIGQLLSLPYAECLLLPLSGRDRSEIAECLLKYISCHTESSINIKSLKVLQEILR